MAGMSFQGGPGGGETPREGPPRAGHFRGRPLDEGGGGPPPGAPPPPRGGPPPPPADTGPPPAGAPAAPGNRPPATSAAAEHAPATTGSSVRGGKLAGRKVPRDRRRGPMIQ